MKASDAIHILLVEDNPDDVRLVTEMLKGAHFFCEITHANRLSAIISQKYNLVLLDLNLPDSSGLNTVIKVREILPNTPIVVMTSVDNEELSLGSIQAGAQDYLVKGQTDRKYLKKTIQYALQRHQTLTKINSLSEKHNVFVATHDILTGLCNQPLFLEHLQLTINKFEATRKDFVLMLLKLHELDEIVATFGHHEKDIYIKTIARSLTEALPMDRTIIIARYSEDVFAIVLNYDQGDEEISTDFSLIKQVLNKPISINIKEYIPYYHIGASVFPMDGKTIDHLINSAQTALTRAIERGIPEHEIFGKEQTYAKNINKKIIWRSDLQFALERNEFIVCYQPQIDVATNSIYGVEALLRWQHPKFGLIFPAEFIPIAEELHLIEAIELWLLTSVSQDYQDWKNKAPKPFSLHLGVNISIQQLQYYSLVETIRKILGKQQIPPNFLQLEFTESTFIDQPEPVIAKLNQLKNLGIRVAIDDFCRGYSSLSYLSHLPVDSLKIDMAFVRQNLEDAATPIILQSVIDLAHSLGLTVFAVGVETKKQFELMKQQNCDVVQGYYFSKPVTANEITKMLTG